jgi:YVTN family beta-propeller protein
MPIQRSTLRLALLTLAAIFAPASLWAVAPLKTIPVGKNPGPVVVNPISHLVYVVNRDDNSVSIIDSQLLTVKTTVKIGAGATAIAANPAANLVYVANTAAGSLTGISGTKVVGTLKLNGTPVALVVDAPLNQLYIADSAGKQILIFNASTGAPVGKLSTTLQPTALAINLATHALFVACTGNSGSVVVIDGTQNQIIKTVSGLPTGNTSISVDPVSNVATLASPTSNIYTVINAANGYAVTEEPADTGADPFATAYDPGGPGAFFEADSGDGNIFFADGTGIINFGNAYQTHVAGAGGFALNPATNQMGWSIPRATLLTSSTCLTRSSTATIMKSPSDCILLALPSIRLPTAFSSPTPVTIQLACSTSPRESPCLHTWVILIIRTCNSTTWKRTLPPRRYTPCGWTSSSQSMKRRPRPATTEAPRIPLVSPPSHWQTLVPKAWS